MLMQAQKGICRITVIWFVFVCLRIFAALEWAASRTPPPKCLAIHTNSTTSFSIFNSLRTLDMYNPIIMASVKIRLESKIDLRIFHIEGKKNVIADALSRQAFAVACSYMPELSIRENSRPCSFCIVYMCHYIHPSSVKSYLSGICAELEGAWPEICTIRNLLFVSRCLSGCMKLLNTPSIWKRALSLLPLPPSWLQLHPHLPSNRCLFCTSHLLPSLHLIFCCSLNEPLICSCSVCTVEFRLFVYVPHFALYLYMLPLNLLSLFKFLTLFCMCIAFLFPFSSVCMWTGAVTVHE